MRNVSPEIYSRMDHDLYDASSDQWWQPGSPFYQIKVAFNPVRVGYIKKILFAELKIDPRGKKALEVGCGGGILSEEIARMGFDTTGIDPSERSLLAAGDHAQVGGLRIHYQRAVGESLPFPDQSYDVVLCCDVLEHVRDLAKVISEISRVLKPGGLFAYDTLNRTWISWLVAIKICQDWKPWAFMPRNLHVWRMFIKPGELKSLFMENNLEWKGHRGMVPNIPIPRLLCYLRKRAKGDWTYGELAEKVQLVEGRTKAVMYMGYAMKKTSSGDDRRS